MPSIIALDIETTGLDPLKDAVIEIGAVKFSGSRKEAEWSSLINPGRPIPPNITQLTGISNEMVRNAPPIRAITQELADFVGNLPVLGHNIRFDLAFLQKQRILDLNDVIDTYELAAILLPTANRYRLGALGQQLGIILPANHRALDDARVTHAVYVELYAKALGLPVDMVAEFVRQSEPFDWDGAYFFKQILRERTRQPIGPKKITALENGPFFGKSQDKSYPSLNPTGEPLPLDEDEVSAILEHGGDFSKFFDAYEQRPQQIAMLRAVTHAISHGNHLLVEAGTGTGKSFAYLIPAALWAIQNNRRIVISTNTINLQDQLINKDIPDLCKALDLDLRAIVLKGRSNYLCPRRFENFRQHGPENSEEMRILGKVLIWLFEGGSGDRGEINLNLPAERDIWTRISAEDEGCKTEVCLSRCGGSCPFFQVRQASQSAHLIIVNHALLLSDISTGSRVLPAYDYLIVDEAHHLEAATTDALSYRITRGDLIRLFREIGGTNSGVLGHISRLMHAILRPSDMAAFEQIVTRATDLVFRLDHDFGEFYTSIEQFLFERREGQAVGLYGQQERILPATRTLPVWTNVEISWEQVHDTLELLINLVGQIEKVLSDLDDANDELQDSQGTMGNIHRRLSEVEANLSSMVSKPQMDQIYWVEIQPNNGQLALQIAPLHIGSLMEHHLWHEKDCIILTSATLTAGGEFDYLRSRLNADEADELVLGSPFDYENSALIYLANDIPEPADATNYQRSVEQALIRLSKATQGRLLALFTSYAQLKRTSQAITPALNADGIQVYEQGSGPSASALVDTFRSADKAVLLGTRSFWEGVDIPGEALSVLVIIKLPFDVPSDPIIAARSETFDDPFNEYSLPEAILRFRQGFGRLIRTQFDRGVVVILDKRLLTKRYGKLFLESLPECKTKIGSLADLPSSASRWLNL